MITELIRGLWRGPCGGQPLPIRYWHHTDSSYNFSSSSDNWLKKGKFLNCQSWNINLTAKCPRLYRIICMQVRDRPIYLQEQSLARISIGSHPGCIWLSDRNVAFKLQQLMAVLSPCQQMNKIWIILFSLSSHRKAWNLNVLPVKSSQRWKGYLAGNWWKIRATCCQTAIDWIVVAVGRKSRLKQLFLNFFQRYF